jgi:hypothetical protein
MTRNTFIIEDILSYSLVVVVRIYIAGSPCCFSNIKNHYRMTV